MGAPSTLADGIVPERVGRYEVLLPIASGGMATVYLARAVGPSGFTTEVALKLTHAHLRTSAEFATELIEEAKLAARIRHGNVVSIIDVGDDPHGLYLVMEYVAGDTLANLLRDMLPTPMAVRLLLDGLAGLHAAHELREEEGTLVGVVHRDFTPQNILVGIDGVARLADFGIAKATSRASHTRQGIVKGKIGYMSPEQAQGFSLDRRSDVWAAAVVAWEILARRRLYRADDDVATMLRVATVRPPLLRSVVPELPEAVEVAVADALVMRAESRYPTALAFSKALSAACRDTVGIAEVDEVAAWMETHVGPKLARRRQHVPPVVAPGAQRTRVDRAAPKFEAGPVSEIVSVTVTTETPHEGTDDPRRAPTVLLPTLRREPELPPVTDGVSVLARKTGRTMALGPRFFTAGFLLSLVVVSVVIWRTSRQDDSHEQVPAASAVGTAPAASGSSAATAVTLRLRANAVIESVRVNDRGVLVDRPSTTVDVDLTGFDPTSSLAIDALAVDGRRAAVAVPADATAVSLQFPAPVTPPPARVRPAARPKARAAPLAPSPYN